MRHEVLTTPCTESGANQEVRARSKTFDKLWRTAGMGFAFGSFMTIALLYALFVFPVIRILPGASADKGRRARRIIGRSFTMFLRSCTALRLILPVRVVGLEGVDLSKSSIVVANHPTLFDIVILGSLIPDFNCVVKHKLMSNLFLRGGVKAARYVTNDRPDEVIQRCMEGFDCAQPLIIFPEGTRSPQGGVGAFSRGAAHLSVRSNIPVITALLECNPPAFRKYQKWYSVPDRPIEFSVRFSNFNCGEEVRGSSCLSIQARLMTEELERFFQHRLGKRAAAAYRPALLIPNHNHKDTIAVLLDKLETYEIDCLIVDDGSESATKQVLEAECGKRDWVQLLRRPQQGGKGAAVMDGLRALEGAGYTHAIQMDADGQHNVADLGKFLSASKAEPEALILGTPKYGPEVPRIRLAGRQISRLLVWFETFSFAISDPLLGYRTYPLKETVNLLNSARLGERMDFDPEIAVRLKWRGLAVKNIATRVSYPAGGLSNFRFLRDNVLMVLLHLRLWLDIIRLRFNGVSKNNA